MSSVGVAIVGTGITATWHAEAIRGRAGVRIALVVGLDEDAAEGFATRHGAGRWSTGIEAVAGGDIDAVILATPSEHHARLAAAALAAGKHVLVEAPMAMSLAAAEALVRGAEARRLVLAVSHPMRLRPPLADLKARFDAGEETLHGVSGRFYAASPRAPLDGSVPAWTDNLLWHHMSHMVDLAVWMSGMAGGRVSGWMGPCEPRLGVPVDLWMAVDDRERCLTFAGSYRGHEIYEVDIVTDRQAYRFDQRRSTFTAGGERCELEPARHAFAGIAPDFLDAIRQRRDPAVPGRSVLPAMAVMQEVQDAWDRLHGARPIPGPARRRVIDAATVSTA